MIWQQPLLFCFSWPHTLAPGRPGFKYYSKSLKWLQLDLIEIAWRNGTKRIVVKVQPANPALLALLDLKIKNSIWTQIWLALLKNPSQITYWLLHVVHVWIGMPVERDLEVEHGVRTEDKNWSLKIFVVVAFLCSLDISSFPIQEDSPEQGNTLRIHCQSAFTAEIRVNCFCSKCQRVRWCMTPPHHYTSWSCRVWLLHRWLCWRW